LSKFIFYKNTKFLRTFSSVLLLFKVRQNGKMFAKGGIDSTFLALSTKVFRKYKSLNKHISPAFRQANVVPSLFF